MAFQTNTIVNGVWTTRTLNLNDVLQHHQKQDEIEKAAVEPHVPPPVYGLLTRTVIESPVVNWILPARIRHMDRNDVVFIGDDLVQLRELHADGTFRDIASKSDFGSRIRSALVIGDVPPYSTSSPGSSPGKSRDLDTEMTDAPLLANGNSTPVRGLPPQYIVLALESGALVFLFVRDRGPHDTEVQFVTRRHTVLGGMLRVRPGANLTVDPSSRYLALSSYQNLFAVYELRSKSELVQQYENKKAFNPVKRERYMMSEGIIHKMEFLYPSFEEKDRIILLLLVINKARTKMYVHVWDAGDDLDTIRPQNPKGHRVRDEAQLPILLIPLRLNSSFLLVTEDRIMLCKDLLEDAPDWIIPPEVVHETSPQHHGIRAPMFTAWARPRRLKNWSYTHDPLYIAREDGVIMSIEIDSENDIEGFMNAGTVECNIGKAFACVDNFADPAAKKDDHKAMSTKMGDILVIGGDFSNGAAYVIDAREHPRVLEGKISNWSPTPDFVVIPTSTGGNELRRMDTNSIRSESNGKSIFKGHATNGNKSTYDNDFSWPDRIFACSGKGSNGAIVELRYGLETRITTSIILSEDYIKQSWVLPDGNDNGHFFVLSLIDHSELLHLSNDSSTIDYIDAASTWLDLSSPTILVERLEGCIVQVTEDGVNVSTATSASRVVENNDKNCFAFPNSAGRTNAEAVIKGHILFMTTRIGLGREIEMLFFRIDPQAETCMTKILPTMTLDSEPTCLFMEEVGGDLKCFYSLASKPGYLFILSTSAGGDALSVPLFALHKYDDEELPELVCHSIAIIRDGFRKILLCGFRDGSFRSFLILRPDQLISNALFNFSQVAEYAEHGLTILARDSTKLGTTAVTVTVDPLAPETAFVRCDSNVYRFVFDATGVVDEPSMSSLHRLWCTDELDPLALQPFVNSITRYSHEGYRDDGNLLITSKSKLLVASLDSRPKAVPRTLPLKVTPTALFYSEALGVLVVAVTIPPALPQSDYNQANEEPGHGRTNLLFVDPESGRDLSNPLDKERSHIAFIKGLGKEETISCLGEWKFHKDGAVFLFILVATSTPTSGSLLFVSPERKEIHGFSVIEFLTRHMLRLPEPAYSFAGSEDGIFICISNKLSWQTLDQIEKRFKPVAEFELPSPGLSIEVQGDLLNVVTARHSLVVVKFSLETKTLLPYLTDQVARRGLQQLAVPHYPIRLMSDRTLSVTGLWYPETAGFTDAASTLFEAELTTSIVKFQTGNAPYNRVCKRRNEAEWFESHESPGQQHSKILGIGIDGSLHHFEVLPQNIWVLLRFIQNMAMHSRRVSPFTYDKEERDELGNFQIEPLAKSVPTTKHVNGDILARCKSLGLAGFKALIKQPLPDDDDFENPETRLERFQVLVEECLGREFVEGKGEGGWDVFWEAYKVMCTHLGAVL